VNAFTRWTSANKEEHMILRALAIGIFLAAVAAAIIVASGIASRDSPATSPEKPIESASAQKHGGVLRVFQYDSPASMSIHEEAFNSAQNPMMAVFNNLVLFRQDVAQNRIDTIEPDLATKWSWNADMTALTFQLRQGVSWHDGKPFTAADVKCTWDLILGTGSDKLRTNPRKAWYRNLDSVTVNGDTVTFHLKRPQPAFIALLASGYSPVYPCHVPAQDMRQHPIGTGPFKFVSYKPNESIKLERNPQYWKPGRPYLDGIEWTIIPNRSTAILGFVAGKFDLTFPFGLTVPLMKDIQKQAPQAVCELQPANQSTNLIVNRDAPPFDNPEIRRAMALALDRKSFIQILAEGHGDIGGAMQPPPQGVWGMPGEMLSTLPGYGPDIAKNREEARNIMKEAGYGPDKRLAVKVSVRNTPPFRDPAIILIDQLREVYIDGELETVESATWFPKVYRKDYKIGLNLTGAGVDDPDAQFYENYACGSDRNYTGYCNPQIDKLFDQQSMERDQEKRRSLVFEIDKKLQEDGARPILFHNRFATCWHPQLKGLTIMVNSLFNGWRMEDVWLEKKPTFPAAAEEQSPPAAAEKPALIPPSTPPGDTRAVSAPSEPPAVSTAAPESRAETPDNSPKSPELQRVQQALEPDRRQVTSSQTSPVADEREQLDPAVRDLITRGWELYYRPYSAVRWQDARRNFERAVELDSRSTEARIGLASILSTKLADGWSPVLQEDLPRAENILTEALDRGTVSNRAAAHFSLGVLRQMQNRLPEAQNEFEAAVSLDPSNARAQLHLGETRLFLGEPEAGIVPLEQAIRLSPDGPNLAIAYWALGTCQLLLGRVDQAIDLLQKARAANPRLWVPYLYLAGAYGLKGDLDKAKYALAESIRLKPSIKSLARMRAENRWLADPRHQALQVKTLNVGLRRAGFPDQ
jgi:peptide/nickel transport system substrate-binding protein